MKEMWPLNTRILRGGEKTGDKGDGQKKKREMGTSFVPQGGKRVVPGVE